MLVLRPPPPWLALRVNAKAEEDEEDEEDEFEEFEEIEEFV